MIDLWFIVRVFDKCQSNQSMYTYCFIFTIYSYTNYWIFISIQSWFKNSFLAKLVALYSAVIRDVVLTIAFRNCFPLFLLCSHFFCIKNAFEIEGLREHIYQEGKKF